MVGCEIDGKFVNSGEAHARLRRNYPNFRRARGRVHRPSYSTCLTWWGCSVSPGFHHPWVGMRTYSLFSVYLAGFPSQLDHFTTSSKVFINYNHIKLSTHFKLANFSRHQHQHSNFSSSQLYWLHTKWKIFIRSHGTSRP